MLGVRGSVRAFSDPRRLARRLALPSQIVAFLPTRGRYLAWSGLSHVGSARLRPSLLRSPTARTEARPPFPDRRFSPHAGYNVGLALLAPEHRRLEVEFNPRCGRICRFFRDAFDSDHYRTMTLALTERFNHLAVTVGEPAPDLAPVEELPGGLASLMETVLPEDSTAFRWGLVFGGVTNDVDSRFDALFTEFVMRHDRPSAHRRRPKSQWGETRVRSH